MKVTYRNKWEQQTRTRKVNKNQLQRLKEREAKGEVLELEYDRYRHNNLHEAVEYLQEAVDRMEIDPPRRQARPNAVIRDEPRWEEIGRTNIEPPTYDTVESPIIIDQEIRNRPELGGEERIIRYSDGRTEREIIPDSVREGESIPPHVSVGVDASTTTDTIGVNEISGSGNYWRQTLGTNV